MEVHISGTWTNNFMVYTAGVFQAESLAATSDYLSLARHIPVFVVYWHTLPKARRESCERSNALFRSVQHDRLPAVARE